MNCSQASSPREVIDPDDDAEPPTVRILAPAIGTAPPRTSASRSIFELGAALARRKEPHGDQSEPEPRPAAAFVQCVRLGGVVRCTGAQYPAARWTEEKAEAERVRRAKQRPPRPTKAARTRGAKVRAWDGEGVE